jgi:hypothetical protein
MLDDGIHSIYIDGELILNHEFIIVNDFYQYIKTKLNK